MTTINYVIKEVFTSINDHGHNIRYYHGDINSIKRNASKYRDCINSTLVIQNNTGSIVCYKLPCSSNWVIPK